MFLITCSDVQRDRLVCVNKRFLVGFFVDRLRQHLDAGNRFNIVVLFDFYTIGSVDVVIFDFAALVVPDYNLVGSETLSHTQSVNVTLIIVFFFADANAALEVDAEP